MKKEESAKNKKEKSLLVLISRHLSIKSKKKELWGLTDFMIATDYSIDSDGNIEMVEGVQWMRVLYTEKEKKLENAGSRELIMFSGKKGYFYYREPKQGLLSLYVKKGPFQYIEIPQSKIREKIPLASHQTVLEGLLKIIKEMQPDNKFYKAKYSKLELKREHKGYRFEEG